MQFDKSQILGLLRSQGNDSTADQADRELPDQVDTDRDAGLLQRFGLTPMEIISALAGGGGAAGVAGRLAGAVGDDDRRGDSGGGIAGKLGGLLGK